MKTTEKIVALNVFVATTEMTEEEINQWFQSRQTSSASTNGRSTLSTGGIKSIFPIAYKKGNEFEILSELILERKDEVWGYEIMPNIILAKKRGADGNVENTSWNKAKAFAEKCIFKGKRGNLPSIKVLLQNWNAELRTKIDKMDKFLYKNGVDAERETKGVIWCSEVYDAYLALYFSLYSGYNNWNYKSATCRYDRLSVAF